MSMPLQRSQVKMVELTDQRLQFEDELYRNTLWRFTRYLQKLRTAVGDPSVDAILARIPQDLEASGDHGRLALDGAPLPVSAEAALLVRQVVVDAVESYGPTDVIDAIPVKRLANQCLTKAHEALLISMDRDAGLG
ncbi:hypothetical protein [Streptomyces sp. HUAS TT7]|uniref:hypothetical protein n=1 Tax=Streptomyces sp. HUAS TT7 TaxID=3447507 RepID=UPI003F65B3DC